MKPYSKYFKKGGNQWDQNYLRNLFFNLFPNYFINSLGIAGDYWQLKLVITIKH